MDLRIVFLLRGASRGRKIATHKHGDKKKNNNNPTPNVICETFALKFINWKKKEWKTASLNIYIYICIYI